MDTQANDQNVSMFILFLIWLLFIFLHLSCTPSPASPPFRPPTQTIQGTTASQVTPSLGRLTPTVTSLATLTMIPCTNDLTFIEDLTIPDGTTLSAGQSIDKQWLVTNSGTCDWDDRYRLKFISGEPLAAPTEQALYPARAGSQATLRIVFTAPTSAGSYQSAWQAFAPDGSAFGQPFFIQIVVQP